MIVFKNYFKILKSHIKSLSIYSIIFLVLIFIFAKSGDPIDKYTSLKLPIYINDKSDTDVSKALIDFIDKSHVLVDVEEDKIDDKLFYEDIVCAISIPEDFEKTRTVDFKEVYDDSYTIFAKNEINSFLNQIETFEKSGFSTSQAIAKSKKNFSKNIKVSVKSPVKNQKENVPYFFKMLGYVIMSQIIMIVGTISLTYNKQAISKRNFISPIKKSSQNLQLILGHIVSGLIVWLIYMIFYCLFFKDIHFSKQTIQMMVNALLFTATIGSFAVMISKLAKKQNTVTGIMNVFSLGSSFLTGIFVPQELLGKFAIKLGKVFPSFYYVKNINYIMTQDNFSLINTNTIILIGFSIAFIIITITYKTKSIDTDSQ